MMISPPDSNEFHFVPERKRPLQKFGKKLKIELSTALGFSPDTVMQAASGLNWNQQFEKISIKGYRALLALKRSHEKGTKMQKSTRRDLEVAFNPFESDWAPLTPEDLAQLPRSISTLWRLLFRGMRRELSPVHRKLLVRLTLYDRVAYQMSVVSDDEEKRRRINRALQPSTKYWDSTGFAVPWQVIVPLDTMLQHLAWLDVELNSQNSIQWPAGHIVRLAEPSKRPMRHWFDTLLEHTKQANLMDFHHYLTAHGVLSRNRVVTHDMLKDWASTEELMPDHAVSAVLKGCSGDIAYIQQHHCLWFSRLFSFSVALLGSFSAEPIEEKAAQAAVHERLLLLCAEIRAARG